ncbi:hypothetical protein [Amycolatopsis sp. GM8]|uniref:hypothetical protein n=1 Tax=Amycolatopsis sp. GM8 TaxID=2896530 RepID=UPI001F181DD7|nr:hypothetical protein [Amycolatopsis sp. GM8]
MNERESAQAAREAREAAGERASSHTTEQLAERAIKQYLMTQHRDDQHEDVEKNDDDK